MTPGEFTLLGDPVLSRSEIESMENSGIVRLPDGIPTGAELSDLGLDVLTGDLIERELER